MEKDSRKFRKATCTIVFPYIVIATESDSHFLSSYIVLSIMNHLGVVCSMQKGVYGFLANLEPFI